MSTAYILLVEYGELYLFLHSSSPAHFSRASPGQTRLLKENLFGNVGAVSDSGLTSPSGDKSFQSITCTDWQRNQKSQEKHGKTKLNMEKQNQNGIHYSTYLSQGHWCSKTFTIKQTSRNTYSPMQSTVITPR